MPRYVLNLHEHVTVKIRIFRSLQIAQTKPAALRIRPPAWTMGFMTWIPAQSHS